MATTDSIVAPAALPWGLQVGVQQAGGLDPVSARQQGEAAGWSTQTGWRPNSVGGASAVKFATTWAELSKEFRNAFGGLKGNSPVVSSDPYAMVQLMSKMTNLSGQTAMASTKAQVLINLSQGVAQSVDKLVKQQ